MSQQRNALVSTTCRVSPHPGSAFATTSVQGLVFSLSSTKAEVVALFLGISNVTYSPLLSPLHWALSEQLQKHFLFLQTTMFLES